MHKPESILENEVHIILWDFDLHTITQSQPED